MDLETVCMGGWWYVVSTYGECGLKEEDGGM